MVSTVLKLVSSVFWLTHTHIILFAISNFFCILSHFCCFSFSSRGKDFLLCSKANLYTCIHDSFTYLGTFFAFLSQIWFLSMIIGNKSFISCTSNIYHSTKYRVGIRNSQVSPFSASFKSNVSYFKIKHRNNSSC